MSTLKVNTIESETPTVNITDGLNVTGVSTVAALNTTSIVNDTPLSNRNIIINGGMKVAQRGISTSITGYGYHTVDRFHTVANSSMTYDVTMSQEEDNPDGVGKCVKLLTNATKTPSGSENYILRYKGEHQDIARVGFGTAQSKTLTVSFSVKSNKTGTFGFQFYLKNFNPSMTVAYTISSANTWERKSINIPAYTTAYSPNADHNNGFDIDWNLASGPDDIMAPFAWQTASTAARGVTGQVNMLDAVGNYFCLTNVQVELGDVATPFEQRLYTEELARCQRYFYRMQNGSSSSYWVGQTSSYGSNNNIMVIHLPVCMRDNPSVATSALASDFQVWGNATVENLSNLPTLRGMNGINPQAIPLDITHRIGTGETRVLRMSNGSFIEFAAEL